MQNLNNWTSFNTVYLFNAYPLTTTQDSKGFTSVLSERSSNYNFEQLHIQSSSTASVMALGKSRLIEEQSRKRTLGVHNEGEKEIEIEADRCMVSGSN